MSHRRRIISAYVAFPVVVAIVLAPTIGSAADTDPCVKNYKAEGSFFTEKKYSTWQDFSDVSVISAFKPAYTYAVKAGYTISQTDKDLGVISASKKIGSGTVTLNILIEGAGAGSKVTTTRTESTGLVSAKKELQAEFCQIMAEVAKALEAK